MGYSEDFIPDGMNAFERNVKRIGDCIIAGVLLLIFSPLFLICYLVVKREDGGPAIFKQERVGRLAVRFIFISFAV
jgi:lipopolysaccharide/colanic/teichoic acid biosynthesis glycosyltransferase